MSRCDLALRVASFLGSSRPLVEIKSDGTTTPCLIRATVTEASVSANGSNAFGIGTPAAAGTGRVTGVAALREDGGDTSLLPGLSFYNDWTVLPTIPTNFFRRAGLGSGGLGQMIEFVFRQGLRILPSSSLVLWMTTTSLASNNLLLLDVSFEFDA